MGDDGNFVIWIVLAAVPIGLLLISRWARARPPGETHLRVSESEPEKPEER
ncbi:hypothetical protein [Bosea sp. (in: a-proteobacteria)]|uniref:hypothetical protein n=1 Tax=Bosea sp. (in: a-proteobacteria) TaxID=1871050 RepID=UPI003341CF08